MEAGTAVYGARHADTSRGGVVVLVTVRLYGEQHTDRAIAALQHYRQHLSPALQHSSFVLMTSHYDVASAAIKSDKVALGFDDGAGRKGAIGGPPSGMEKV